MAWLITLRCYRELTHPLAARFQARQRDCYSACARNPASVAHKRKGHNMRFRFSAALLATLATAVALAADNPQYGSWGFDASGVDAKTRPGDDFFRYTNGAWLDRTRIPPDKPAFSLRILMTVRTEQRLHDMMEKAARNDETSDIVGKVGAFYKAFMDEGRIETLGAKPIAPELDALRAVRTRDRLAGLMGKSTAA